MRRILSWLLVTSSLVLALAAVGFLLPPIRSVQRSARYARPVSDLWTAATDFTGHARWRQAIERVQALADRNGHPAYRELGRGFERTYEVTSFVAPRHLELCFDDRERRVRGTWTLEFERDGDGTRLSITESAECENVFVRLADYTLVDRADELELFLVELGRLFGEDVHPAAAARVDRAPLGLGI